MSFLTGEQIRVLTNPRALRLTLKHIFFRWTRKILEMAGIDIMSKPYGVDDMTEHERLMRHFPYRNGFFLEVGGHDGYFHSPTYYLEKFQNWTGVLIEPVPSLARRCAKERKRSSVYNYACTRSATPDGVVEFVSCGHSSHVKGSIEEVGSTEEMQAGMRPEDKIISVPATTLSKLLDKYFNEHGEKKIDLFVLDVEGFELEVIGGLDFTRYAPKNMLVERPSGEMASYLKERNYDLVGQISHNDYLYRLKEAIDARR